MEVIAKVEGLTAAYGGKTILENVSCEVKAGEIFVVLGGSGCGKSTLLKHMIGLVPPAAGKVWIEGKELATAEGAAREAILKRIGVMYQQGALFGSMTLLENARLPLEAFTKLPEDARDAVARSKLSLVGLDGFDQHMPSEISGGMRKRAAIARALALDPPLLFLDEPSAGLDPVTSADLDQLITRLSRSLGLTFVVVTHELPSIYAIADRVIMLDKKTKGVIAEGKPAELRDRSEDPWVRRFFRREAESA